MHHEEHAKHGTDELTCQTFFDHHAGKCWKRHNFLQYGLFLIFFTNNCFSPNETDDMESFFHVSGIGDYLDQLIIPSHG